MHQGPKFPRRIHDGLYPILDILRTALEAISVQHPDGKDVDGTLDRKVHRLIHEDLECAVGDAHRGAVHGKDPIAELVVLVHGRAEAHSHEAVLQRPRGVEIQHVLPIEQRLAQPIPQEVDDDVDDRLRGHGLLAEGVLVGRPRVEGNAHANFDRGPAAGHAPIDVEDGDEDVAEAGGEEGEVEDFGGDGLAVGVLLKEEFDEGRIVRFGVAG